jgi:glycosyltransferase involved in cell wall biosynthesis
MKIAFLAKRHSIHTVRWVNALAERGHDIHLISSIHYGDPLHPRVHFHPLHVPPPTGFFLNVFSLKRLLKDIQPDLLNTHFASGYGTLARLGNFHPHVLSVWGSDVFDFPNKSPLHLALIRANLRAADWIASTSQAMAQQTASLCSELRISVVPFGIDTEFFKPALPVQNKDTLIIGTVKTLAPKYGIDLLIRAFAELRQRLDTTLSEKLRLLIVGGGPDEALLKKLAEDLGVSSVTTFVSYVPHARVPDYLNQLDIYVALSRLDSESFGVAVLEASACELPVVVANVGGLPEVVQDKRTGYIVPRENPEAAASALEQLIENDMLRKTLGEAGRKFVLDHYDWQKNVSALEAIFHKVVKLKE